MFFLLVKLLKIIKDPKPYPNYSMLSYNQNAWHLHDENEQEQSYEKAEIILDAGLFFLLVLINDQKRNYLVVFFDQIDVENYRLLNIMQKIR